MNRAALRGAVETALGSVGFGFISQGKPGTSRGASLYAVITSSGTQREWFARNTHTDTHAIAVMIYVLRTAGDDGEAAEDLLDTTMAAVIAAIDAIDRGIVFERSDAGNGDTPNRRFDGKIWRVERVLLSLPNEVT